MRLPEKREQISGKDKLKRREPSSKARQGNLRPNKGQKTAGDIEQKKMRKRENNLKEESQLRVAATYGSRRLIATSREDP